MDEWDYQWKETKTNRKRRKSLTYGNNNNDDEYDLRIMMANNNNNTNNNNDRACASDSKKVFFQGNHLIPKKYSKLIYFMHKIHWYNQFWKKSNKAPGVKDLLYFWHSQLLVIWYWPYCYYSDGNNPLSFHQITFVLHM